MRFLALIFEPDAPPGTFGDVVGEHGHDLAVHSFVPGVADPPPADAGTGYDGVMIFGGSMQVDQDDRHPWLADIRALIRELLDGDVPLLGVCLGAQLIAQTAGGEVGPAVVREVGWFPVELTAAGAHDPLLGHGPARFAAFEAHSYGFALPPAAVPLALGQANALQAFRLGDAAWGVQFHPEVTVDIVESWIVEHLRDGEIEDEAVFRDQLVANMPRWIAFGRALCGRFVDYASAARSRNLRRP